MGNGDRAFSQIILVRSGRRQRLFDEFNISIARQLLNLPQGVFLVAPSFIGIHPDNFFRSYIAHDSKIFRVVGEPDFDFQNRKSGRGKNLITKYLRRVYTDRKRCFMVILSKIVLKNICDGLPFCFFEPIPKTRC